MVQQARVPIADNRHLTEASPTPCRRHPRAATARLSEPNDPGSSQNCNVLTFAPKTHCPPSSRNLISPLQLALAGEMLHPVKSPPVALLIVARRPALAEV